jgi:hypothetical protein
MYPEEQKFWAPVELAVQHRRSKCPNLPKKTPLFLMAKIQMCPADFRRVLEEINQLSAAQDTALLGGTLTPGVSWGKTDFLTPQDTQPHLEARIEAEMPSKNSVILLLSTDMWFGHQERQPHPSAAHPRPKHHLTQLARTVRGRCTATVSRDTHHVSLPANSPCPTTTKHT